MPSPIAHAVSGYALSRIPLIKHRDLPPSPSPILTIYAIVIACLPDLDFLPQILTGLRFHRGPSHSLFAALLVSSFLAWVLHHYRRTFGQAIASAFGQFSYPALFAFTFGLYSSHLGLDLLTHGGSGIPLFWPAIPQNVQLPFALFPAVHHSRGLLDSSHLVFISAELLYSLVVLIGLRLFNASSSSPSIRNPSQDS